MFFEVVLIAYIIDMFVGEFAFIKHPVILMGNYISWFEKYFYTNSIFTGMLLTLSLLCIVFIISYTLSLWDNIWVQGFLASFCLSSKMLYDEVKKVISSSNPKDAISMLVSRDTDQMSESDINKACIETYAENLSDGVIAPLFYLLIFGIVGGFLYKAVNTLDSMVGYRNERYEKFGKFSARLDDILNYIPARITAILIALCFKSKEAFLCFYQNGKEHESINAGLPIASMAYSLGLALGGPTSYFGKVKEKPYFGKGRKKIYKEDVLNALRLKLIFDMGIIITIGSLLLFV